MATAFSPSLGKSAVRPRTLVADNGRDADSFRSGVPGTHVVSSGEQGNNGGAGAIGTCTGAVNCVQT